MVKWYPSGLLFSPGKDLVPIVQEAGWAPGPVWTGAENLTPTGIRSTDCPARSQLLYRLRYPAHLDTSSNIESRYPHCDLYGSGKKKNGINIHNYCIPCCCHYDKQGY